MKLKYLLGLLIFFASAALIYFALYKKEGSQTNASTKTGPSTAKTTTQSTEPILAKEFESIKPKLSKLPALKNQISEITSEEAFQRVYGRKWRFRKKKGKILRVMGDRLKLKNEKKEVLQLAQRTAPLFGVSSADLTEPKVSKQSFGKRYTFKQTHRGFEVYRHRMVIHTQSRDNSVVMIANELEPIETTWEDSTPVKARGEINQFVGEMDIGYVVPKQGSPVVFVQEGVAQLGWIYSTPEETLTPKAVEVVLSAEDGRLLAKRALAIAD